MLTFYVQNPDHSEVTPCNTGEHIVFRTQTTVKSSHLTGESTLYVQDPDHSEASPRDIGETARKTLQTYYAFHF